MARALNQSYEEMVVKARQLFWTEGFQNITVDDLATHLEVSPTVLYNKYNKELLFIDALDSYISSLSNPILSQIENSEEGIETFRSFFYGLIDALLTKTFPRSCLMVNTVVELHNQQDRLNLKDVYSRYFGNMRKTYLVILERAVALKEIKHSEKVGVYADFLVGIIFGISVLYRVKTKEQLHKYIDGQLALIR